MQGMSQPPDKLQPDQPPQPSKQTRNRTATRKNWSKVEDYLMHVEKSRGIGKALELREKLERGEVTLDELTGR
jgi:hypothetical protein